MKEDESKVKMKGKIEDVGLPSNLVDTVLERVDCLDDSTKSLIKYAVASASILGMTTWNEKYCDLWMRKILQRS